MDDMFKTVVSALLFLSLAGIVYLLWTVIKLSEYLKKQNPEGKKLQLLAYERLAMFTERAGLRAMITNAEAHGESAAIMHGVLIQNLKSEYDYNVSQQIYVSKEVWGAVTKLKDQNIYVINQLAAMLPPGATSLDLSKRILEYTLAQNTELNTVVHDAIQHEAKQQMERVEG
jgi:hypothetical protein